MNIVTLMGRLTRDPELRHTQGGTAVASFSLAVDRRFSGRDGGERQVDFIDVVAWRNSAEFVSKYFTKGRMCAVQGRLQVRDWQDKDGNKRRAYEVVADQIYFAGDKGQGGGNTGGYASPGYTDRDAPPIDAGFGQGPSGGSDFAELDDDDGELPF